MHARTTGSRLLACVAIAVFAVGCTESPTGVVEEELAGVVDVPSFMNGAGPSCVTLQFDLPVGPRSYVEQGIQVTSLFASQSVDVRNGVLISISSNTLVFRRQDGAPFTLQSLLVVTGGRGGRAGTITGSLLGDQVFLLNPGTVTFPAAGWTGIREFRWITSRGILDNVVICSASTNSPPDADAGLDRTLEWERGLSATLDGTGSTDPDGDALTYEWKDAGGTIVGTAATASVPLSGLGTFAFTLTVTDPSGETDSEDVTITAEDTTAPEVTASLVPVGGDDDDEGRFRVEYSCSDTCDDSPSITAATVNGITVANGQIVELELEDDDEGQEVEFDDGILQIEAASFELVVTCVDESGNAGLATVEPVFTDDEDDGDEDDDDDEGDDDDDDGND